MSSNKTIKLLLQRRKNRPEMKASFLFNILETIADNLSALTELKFLKHGCLRSKNATTGERYNSGPLREQLLIGAMEQ